MAYISTKEASNNWDISERRIRGLCQEGRIEGAVKIGRNWAIPVDAHKPVDARQSEQKKYLGLGYDFSQIDTAMDTINRHRPFSKGLADSLHEKLIVEWTYNSNAIEGNTLTMSETKVVLEGITIGGKSLVEHLEIINHRDAILFIEQLVSDKEPLSEWNIKNIHALVLKQIDNQNAGKYRSENVVISGAKHIPPKHYQISEYMQKLIAEYQNEWLGYHPVVRATLLHGEFVKIHPFIDGNGRTSRLLLNFELMKSGYPPIIIKNENRADYYKVLDHAHTTMDYGPFIKFVAELVIESEKLWLTVLECQSGFVRKEGKKMPDKLTNLGFTDRFAQEATLYPDLHPARVIAQYKELYRVATVESEMLAEISGKMRHAAVEMSDYPAVGDFVMIDRNKGSQDHVIIHHTLTRKSVFIRKAAGKAHDVQVVAANIDIVFICMSLNNDFNLRRLERYLAIAWDSGATPVIVLTKADLCADIPEKLREIETIAFGVDVLVTSSLSEDGYTAVLKYITLGQTVVFIGSSGVGKSTLINRILGEDLNKTREIRRDDKGRHATTNRELFLIPTGGCIIDTPGMRELGLESVNLARTFVDIDELAEQCKFKDCKHENEPGCMVRKAIAEGILTEERLQSYLKLKKEAKYEGMNSKQIEKEKISTMFSDFGGIKNARKFAKSKNKEK